MASKPDKNIGGPLRIDSLSQKLKLKVSDVNRIKRSKKPSRASQTQSSGIADRCQNVSNGLFQMLLRAGAEEHIETFLKEHGLEILKSKFFILISNHEIVICDESSNLVTKHNAKIHLNALHLAILAQQGRAVGCILKGILTDKTEEEHTKKSILFNILSTEIELENVSNASSDINKLNLKGMNAFHLSCQCFPKAIEIFSALVCDHEGKCSLPVLENLLNVLKNVVEGKNRDGNTPLHIAAKQSSVESVR